MTRCIEVEKALKIIDNYSKTVTADAKVVVDAVRDIIEVITPAADLVEVVRCKDCIHQNPFGYKCLRDNLWHNADDFCSYGERKE